jgi:hypothetical protein
MGLILALISTLPTRCPAKALQPKQIIRYIYEIEYLARAVTAKFPFVHVPAE